VTRRKAYLILQSLLCIALTFWMIIGILALFREGTELKQANPLASIYTPEKLSNLIASVAPVCLLTAGCTLAGLILGIRDERQDQPGKALRAQHAAEEAGKTFSAAEMPQEERRVRTVRIVLLTLAAALIIAGILNGGIRDVLVKAINLCTECVGLG